MAFTSQGLQLIQMGTHIRQDIRGHYAVGDSPTTVLVPKIEKRFRCGVLGVGDLSSFKQGACPDAQASTPQVFIGAPAPSIGVAIALLGEKIFCFLVDGRRISSKIWPTLFVWWRHCFFDMRSGLKLDRIGRGFGLLFRLFNAIV